MSSERTPLVIVMPRDLRPGFHEAVRAVDPAIELALVSNDGPLPANVAQARVFYRSVALRREVVDNVLQHAPHLEWMHVPAAGVDAALTPEVLGREFIVTNVAGVYDEPVSEMVLTLMLAASKRLRVYFDAQRDHRWFRAATWDNVQQEAILPESLHRKAVAILGFGGIGRSLAEKLRPFQARILGYRRSGEPDPLADEMYGLDQLSELLPQADWVVLALPHPPATEHMNGRAELDLMKTTAWIVNIRRGRLIDDDALVAALTNGTIGGACLDVFSKEPLPADSPYWDLPNVIVTPHIAGAFPELNEIDREYFIADLRRYLTGQPLRSVVDREGRY
jgi:phosphoglycerate dehydrogenase-like enzyme